MSELRIIFEKTGKARYLSHLDIMRTFIRAMNRANVPVAHSQGFNPHPKLSIAHPLPVGVEGVREVLDIELEDTQTVGGNAAGAVEQGVTAELLTSVLPEGLAVSEVYIPISNVKAIAFTNYRFEFVYDGEIPDTQALCAFFKRDEIPAIKRSKKGTKTINLRPLFTRFEVSCEGINLYSDDDLKRADFCREGDCKGGTLYIDVTLVVGEAPPNPRLFAAALEGTPLAPDFMRARRLGFITSDGKPFI